MPYIFIFRGKDRGYLGVVRLSQRGGHWGVRLFDLLGKKTRKGPSIACLVSIRLGSVPWPLTIASVRSNLRQILNAAKHPIGVPAQSPEKKLRKVKFFRQSFAQIFISFKSQTLNNFGHESGTLAIAANAVRGVPYITWIPGSL